MISALTFQKFTIVVDIQRTSIIGPSPAWRTTIQVDGRIIARTIKNVAQTRLERVKTMLSEDQGKLVEGRFTFSKLASPIVTVERLRLT
jgi:hypothetical protein